MKLRDVLIHPDVQRYAWGHGSVHYHDPFARGEMICALGACLVACGKLDAYPDSGDGSYEIMQEMLGLTHAQITSIYMNNDALRQNDPSTWEQVRDLLPEDVLDIEIACEAD